MSKRQAEKQLRKGDASDDESEEIGVGFQAADPSVLATRKIKGLPKRDVKGPAAPPSMPAPPTANRFAGFAGFSPTPPSTATNSTPAANPFAFTTSKPMNGATPFSKPLAPETSMSAPPPLTPQPTEPLQEEEAELLTGYRGLNKTFMDLVTSELRKDPFVDISSILSRYQKCRETLKLTASSKTMSSLEPTKAEHPTSGFTPNQEPEQPKKTTPPVAPKPPNMTFDFGAPKTSNSPFSFGVPAASGPFSGTFGSARPTGSIVASKPEPPQKPQPATPSNPFSFPSTPGGSSFTFGTSSSSAHKFTFGATSTGFGAATTASTSTSPGRSGSLGNPVGFTFGSPKDDKKDPLSDSQAPKPTFPLFGGSPKEMGSSTFTPFGAASTDASSSQPKSTLQLPGTGALTPGLSSREETPLSEAAGTEGTNAESTENTEVAEDEVFEGEEEETTLHSIKAKISKLAVEGGKGEWKPMGLGWLKLKRHDESGTQRILLRDSTSRRVILNCRLFKGLNVSLAGAKLVKLGLIEDQKPVQYLCRVTDAEGANELKKRIEELVASLDST